MARKLTSVQISWKGSLRLGRSAKEQLLLAPIRKYSAKSIRSSAELLCVGVGVCVPLPMARVLRRSLSAPRWHCCWGAGRWRRRRFCGKWCRRAAPKVNWLLFDKGTPLELTWLLKEHAADWPGCCAVLHISGGVGVRDAFSAWIRARVRRHYQIGQSWSRSLSAHSLLIQTPVFSLSFYIAAARWSTEMALAAFRSIVTTRNWSGTM